MSQHSLCNEKESLDLRKENNAGVGHGVGQAQDAAAHDGVAQVEDRHAERSVARMLPERKVGEFTALLF